MSTMQVPSPGDGRNYTAAVYGSLLVTTLLAVQWWNDADATFVGLTLVISVAVFWLAHSWAAMVDRRVHGPLRRSDAIAIAAGQAPMLLAAIIPSLILGLAVIGLLTVDQALGVALAVSLVQLFLWGLVAGFAAHSSAVVALGVALVDLGLGVAIVILKVIVIH